MSELQAVLSKIQSTVGDVAVVLKDVESEAETEIKSLGIDLSVGASTDGSTATISHGPAAPAEPEPATDPEPASPGDTPAS